MDELAYVLIEFIREGSPVVMAVLMRQVYVEVVSNFVWAGVLAAAYFILLRFGIYCRSRSGEEYLSDWEIGMIVSYILAAIVGLIFPVAINEAVSRLVNPEFYAIQLLLQGFTR